MDNYTVLSIPEISNERQIWLIRTNGGLYYNDFTTNKYVALGWDAVSVDLLLNSSISNDAKKEKINELYPDEKRPGLIFSQLYNFHCVMNNGDLVLIPSEGTKFIRVGVLGETVEEVSKDLIMKAHLRYKPVCANVDFYSGFVYTMLGIPRELFTPIFAIARISGWSAHRLEELVNKGKIIRPAYKYVGSHVDFREIDERE